MANQWTRIADKNKKRLIKVARASTLFAGNQIVQLSPVKSGRFRGNWNTSFGAPDVGTSDQGHDSFGVLSSQINDLNTGETIYFTNSLPYALRLEFGWSDQSPNGMVRLTVAKWPLIVDRIARKLK
jgi:hypothetical protein